MKIKLTLLAGALFASATLAQAQPIAPQLATPTPEDAREKLDERLEAARKNLEEARKKLAPLPELAPRLRPVPPNTPKWFMPNPYVAPGPLAPNDFNRVLRAGAKRTVEFKDGKPVFAPLFGSDPEINLTALPSAQGEWFWLEVEDSTVASVLQTVIDRMGARAVIDPELSKSYYAKGGFDGSTLADLLGKIGGDAIDSWRAPSGVYFFAHNPAHFARGLPSDLYLLPRSNR